jgi:galactonate dehydratase
VYRRHRKARVNMKIVDVKTRIVNLHFRNVIFVTVETDEGITGISETVMKRKTLTVEQSVQELKRYLIGKDPTEIENHWEKMYRDSFWVGGPLHSSAISAIDCALWDILGKRCGLPVYRLLGGPTRKEVFVYCHCPSGESPEEFASNVKECALLGYRAIKTTLPLFYGGNGNGPNGSNYSGTAGRIDRCWKETEYLDASVFRRIREYFQAAREAAGASFGIAVDCHGRLSLKHAIRLCRQLEDLDLMFIEEPVPPENAEVLKIVQRESAVPIAAGERWVTIYGVREFLEKQAIDLLQCDIVNAGGISGMRKIAALAEAYYISMAPHNPNGPLATAINLQFAATIPNFHILETIGSSDECLFAEIVKKPPRFNNGYLELSEEPGLGIELNYSAFDRYPYHPHEGWR